MSRADWKVRCNTCGWEGDEFELGMCKDEGEFFKGCPECKTDENLMDLSEEEVDL